MFTASLYLLLTISIVTKYAHCFVVDNSASIRTEAESQTDNRPTSFFDTNSNNNNANEIGNRIGTSAINVTATDNAMEMPKPNDAVDYLHRASDDALADVETGELLILNLFSCCRWFLCSLFASLSLFLSSSVCVVWLIRNSFSVDWLTSRPFLDGLNKPVTSKKCLNM